MNSAGVQSPWKPLLEQAVADYAGQFRSCVWHSVHRAQALVPAMFPRRWGRVIAINTGCVLQMLPARLAYVGGKCGMDGVLRVLAKEVGEGMANVVAFLASDLASFITGAYIPVCGGNVMPTI